ncbi:A/G-specific adenine glycosylase [Planctomycetes bacterium CA13]|uniref:Adenine DNA glycosylase n=2 Tax=Novipirellula herctigrandis TaxID=2527986 RepID=A0A5C5ZB39_9BACT|nr:A/G-specific adenine glycosylase [Planctomycetes bacterium CA13]
MSSDFPPHDVVWQTSAWRSRVRKRLLDWYASNARDLPWRSRPGEPLTSPYRVWVSEIMLQQTQVTTVVPYYERFTTRFPTVDALAAIDEPTLMTLWEGLGYYRRARSMHAAAKHICDQHDGEFPTNYDDTLALPGIGRYTAGAILSIATDQRLPILEGNTQRLFSRWIAMQGSLGEKPTMDLLWSVADAMLPQTGSGIFNQAAMELGALVCTPRNPKCDECPVVRMCRAKEQGLEQSIPGKVKRIQYEDRTEFAFVIANDKKDRYLVRPIAAGQRWAGLWDFPRVTSGKFDNVDDAAASIGHEMSGVVAPLKQLATLKHAVTKYRIRLDVFVASVSGKPPKRWKATPPWQFMTKQELVDLPLSVTGRKIAQKLP